MNSSPLLDQLIEAFRCLPGVGPKSAQRMAFHLLKIEKEKAQRLGTTITHALESIQHCKQCSCSKGDSKMFSYITTPT